jgi:hypothetical protein
LLWTDAGLMSNKNINELLAKQYDFIIGARIKNEIQQLQAQILPTTYSNARVAKDAHNRNKGLKCLKNHTERRLYQIKKICLENRLKALGSPAGIRIKRG